MNTWFSTRVDSYKNLASELQRLEDDSHTIFSVLNIDGFPVILSYTTA